MVQAFENSLLWTQAWETAFARCDTVPVLGPSKNSLEVVGIVRSEETRRADTVWVCGAAVLQTPDSKDCPIVENLCPGQARDRAQQPQQAHEAQRVHRGCSLHPTSVAVHAERLNQSRLAPWEDQQLCLGHACEPGPDQRSALRRPVKQICAVSGWDGPYKRGELPPDVERSLNDVRLYWESRIAVQQPDRFVANVPSFVRRRRLMII